MKKNLEFTETVFRRNRFLIVDGRPQFGVFAKNQPYSEYKQSRAICKVKNRKISMLLVQGDPLTGTGHKVW